MTKKAKVLNSLRRGPRSAKQLEHHHDLPSASAVVSSLRKDGMKIESRQFDKCRKYVLIA